ncbi:putative DNA polymerase III, epsilon subunit [Bulleidia extructa W1219]|jgi:DNA polymerase III, epsilon subunit and related 3''-5'' exonucleases|uniref:Putative DNA polymerase III, epsilon subunit n=1 Tax=Bulleidia extructa W1219 TaxID=679192 RepID=D2MNZ8_9FIRM|nr:3'-5' exonuclease [Bulleidia extructa]EFC05767.1 putative DNA polymerase III, epsilon subunit [Bulleidia extructa W1219]
MTRVVAVDVETASSDHRSMCAIGLSVLENGVLEEAFYSLIKPAANANHFEYFNTKVHGIHPKDVQDAPTLPEVYPTIKSLLESGIVVAHNAVFDVSVIKNCCLNTGCPVPKVTYFDSVPLSRRAFPLLVNHKLDTVARYLKIPLDHHHAGSDAYACLAIVAAAMAKYEMCDCETMLNYLKISLKRM